MSYNLQKISNVINHKTINLNKNLKLWNAYKTVYESGTFHHTGLYNNTNKYYCHNYTKHNETVLFMETNLHCKDHEMYKLNQWLQSSGYTLPKLKRWLPVLNNTQAQENPNEEINMFVKELDAKEHSSIKVLDMTYEWYLETSEVLLKQLEQKRENS